MQLHEHTVRFGDIAVGEQMHQSKVFDIGIRSLETLVSELEVGIADIVEMGGVPYAPVDVRGRFTGYPQINETVSVDGTVMDVGDNHFEVAYSFETETSSVGRLEMVHISVAPEGGSKPLAAADKEYLERQEAPSETPSLQSFNGGKTGETFSNTVTFHSPYIEAAGLGYIEDYFKFIGASLEDHLAGEGIPIRDLEPAAPFVPTDWAFIFDKPIWFGDEITVRGAVSEVAAQTVTVEYALTGADPTDGRIRGDMTYQCWNEDEAAVPFPPEVREKLTPD